MPVSDTEYDQLLREHAALIRAHARVQARCTEQLQAQAREIARLRAEAMRTRALLIRRTSELAWSAEERAALELSIPGLPKRVALARRVLELEARVRSLQDERRDGPKDWPHTVAPASGNAPGGERMREREQEHEHAQAAPGLEESLEAADLVICQSGCVSHGAYWRVRDHCKRTGKTCVLVDDPQALRVVRITRGGDPEEEGAALVTARQVL